jgi:hypothetical protein
MIPQDRLAPYAVMRVAAVSYRRLLELTPPRHTSAADAVLAAERRLENLRPAIEDDLHAAVPVAVDRDLRRAIIELRRAVHGGRPPRLTAAERSRVLGALAGAAVDRLAAWFDIESGRSAALAVGEGVLAAEGPGHLRARLRGFLDEPDFACALALASPDLLRQLVREASKPPSGAASSKSERSLLAYAVRAAAKTNPFSSFVYTAIVPIQPDRPTGAPDLAGLARVARIVVDRGLVDRLHRGLVASVPDGEAVRYARNLSFRVLGQGRLEAIAADYRIIQGRFWRMMRRSSFRLPRGVAETLAALPSEASAPEVAARLAGFGIDANAVRSLIRQLLAVGLLAPPPATDAFDPDPAATLLALPGSAARAALEPMQAAARELSGAAAGARVAIVERVRQHEQATLAALQIPDAPPCRNPLVETATFGGLTGPIGRPLADLIATAATTIRDRVVVDPTYAVFRDRFVRAFGAGGTVGDVVGYLVAEHAALATLPAGPVEPCRPGATPVTLALQIAAADRAASAAGDALAIVNRIYPGVGWMTGRYARGQGPAEEALRGWMRDWIASVVAPLEPIDLLLSGECNELQAHPRVTERVLVWPTEPLRAGTAGASTVDELSLAHDPGSNRIVFADRAGTRLVPIVFGSSLILPVLGVTHLLSLLASPHTVLYPDEIPPGDGIELEHRPRAAHGRVVVRRAEWWLRSRTLRGWLDGNGSARLLRARRELERRGIPRRFFARRPHASPGAALASLMRPEAFSHKPLWVDAANPFCLDLLERSLDASEWTVIAEVLPDEDGLWATVDDEPRVTELLVEAVI